MSWSANYEPSPWAPIADQVALYERTGGAEGNDLTGATCIILWTVGAQTGSIRKTPLIRVEHEGSYAVVGSLGGSPTAPQWVHNLKADGRCQIQDGPVPVELKAREVFDEEKALWWARAVAVWPAYDTYQASTDRVIPVFVLSP